MGYFGYVLVNGTPKFGSGASFTGAVSVASSLTVTGQIMGSTGSTAAPGFAFTGLPTLGMYAVGNTIAFDAVGSNPVAVTNSYLAMSSATELAWNNNPAASGANPDTAIKRIAANKIGVYDTSTTAGIVRVGGIEWDAAQSTFAQTATMTNGPRAANPQTWVSVSFNNGASTGRIPIW